MDGHCLSPYTCKHCIVFKQFDGINSDSLAEKHQKRQNFPCQNLRYTVHRTNNSVMFLYA